MKRIRVYILLILALAMCPAENAFGKAQVHVVQKGETLWKISRKHHVPAARIKKLNGMRSPYRLYVGQKVLIPGKTASESPRDVEGPQAARRTEIVPDSDYGELERLCKVYTRRRGRWLYVVIHHSATDAGNAVIFDRYHRYKRHMENGLAYHFVIDNGIGGADGRIEVGRRWKTQCEGGHTSNRLMNKVGIGICLVGNFQKSFPTKKQLRSLCRLVRYLQTTYNIPDRNVIGHRHVKGQRTECPGRKFPIETFKRMLKETP
jgi:murein DD-endopeptidase MepM/ murein hydrolase activator NlpD